MEYWLQSLFYIYLLGLVIFVPIISIVEYNELNRSKTRAVFNGLMVGLVWPGFVVTGLIAYFTPQK